MKNNRGSIEKSLNNIEMDSFCNSNGFKNSVRKYGGSID
jgi:hypothetical protein